LLLLELMTLKLKYWERLKNMKLKLERVSIMIGANADVS